jgi:hypothetical protein
MSAQAKHSPGPWFASSAYGDGSALWIAPQEGPAMVLQGAKCLRSDSVTHEQISIDQLQTNAALIAAAPELLAALKYIIDPATNESGDWYREGRNRAYAAIAKATGGAV